MTATAPPPVANRIARHFAPPLPQIAEERQAVWADTLAAAMLFYQRQLQSPVAGDAERAARAIFELEKTRLRHGRDLAGADTPPPPRDDILPPLGPYGLPTRHKPSPAPAVEPEEDDFDDTLAELLEADLAPAVQGQLVEEVHARTATFAELLAKLRPLRARLAAAAFERLVVTALYAAAGPGRPDYFAAWAAATDPAAVGPRFRALHAATLAGSPPRQAVRMANDGPHPSPH